MKQRRLPLACALAASALLFTAAPASAIRYAAPTASGSGDCSSVANACTVSAAVEGDGSVPPPPSGEEIVVLAGDHVLSNTLNVNGTLNIHGQDGSPRPTLRMTGASGYTVLSSLASPGTLRRLRIHGDDNTGTVATVNASGVAISTQTSRFSPPARPPLASPPATGWCCVTAPSEWTTSSAWPCPRRRAWPTRS